ncbi:unnamed protein product [Moneuplotes crassus]|uniref:Uncharacterized protein n=1 Tax=Euplotes crassus TaxID=5936 RepID=A0AAD1U6U6_EUPCR|nr:unnamed protein product [Moneuplotes crassus]
MTSGSPASYKSLLFSTKLRPVISWMNSSFLFSTIFANILLLNIILNCPLACLFSIVENKEQRRDIQCFLSSGDKSDKDSIKAVRDGSTCDRVFDFCSSELGSGGLFTEAPIFSTSSIGDFRDVSSSILGLESCGSFTSFVSSSWPSSSFLSPSGVTVSFLLSSWSPIRNLFRLSIFVSSFLISSCLDLICEEVAKFCVLVRKPAAPVFTGGRFGRSLGFSSSLDPSLLLSLFRARERVVKQDDMFLFIVFISLITSLLFSCACLKNLFMLSQSSVVGSFLSSESLLPVTDCRRLLFLLALPRNLPLAPLIWRLMGSLRDCEFLLCKSSSCSDLTILLSIAFEIIILTSASVSILDLSMAFSSCSSLIFACRELTLCSWKSFMHSKTIFSFLSLILLIR